MDYLHKRCEVEPNSPDGSFHKVIALVPRREPRLHKARLAPHEAVHHSIGKVITQLRTELLPTSQTMDVSESI